MHHAPGRTDRELDQLAAAAFETFSGAVLPTTDAITEVLHE
jgi:hypothetical protein